MDLSLLVMNLLETIVLTLVQLFRAAAHFARVIAKGVTQPRQRILIEAQEAERLDRIRNPSKHLGKQRLEKRDHSSNRHANFDVAPSTLGEWTGDFAPKGD